MARVPMQLHRVHRLKADPVCTFNLTKITFLLKLHDFLVNKIPLAKFQLLKELAKFSLTL